jgi:hypothetical protein
MILGYWTADDEHDLPARELLPDKLNRRDT